MYAFAPGTIPSFQPSLKIRIDIRGMLPDRAGRFGDRTIGRQAVEKAYLIVTNDKALKAVTENLGGSAR